MTATPSDCPICGGHSYDSVGVFNFSDWQDLSADELQRNNFSYDIVNCRICGHVMASHDYGNDFVTALYNRPQGTDCWSNEPHDPLDPYRDMISFAQSHIPTGGLVVDFGAGNGQILSLLKDEGGVEDKRLMGIDFANYMQNDLPFQSMDLNNIESAEGSTFDFAFCTHLLEHVFDPRAFLRGMNQHAATGAKIYLEVPDITRTDNASTMDTNLFNPQHLHQFSLNNLVQLTESTGWRVLEKESLTTGFIPRARLIAEKKNIQIERNASQQVLSIMKDAEKKLCQCIKDNLSSTPLNIWGIGGDFMTALEQNTWLQDALKDQSLVLFDRDLAHKMVFGVTIRSSSELPNFQGPIVLTPRPSKTKEPMKAFAKNIGVFDKLIDPYTVDKNA